MIRLPLKEEDSYPRSIEYRVKKIEIEESHLEIVQAFPELQAVLPWELELLMRSARGREIGGE
jgi:hypothetical protein